VPNTIPVRSYSGAATGSGFRGTTVSGLYTL
jgi:hypothetical protein